MVAWRYMYEAKVAKAYGRGGVMSCGVAIVGAVLGFALLAVVLYLVRGGDIEPQSPRFALALATPMIFIAVVVAMAALTVFWRGHRLDRAFEPWRLEGQQSGPGIRSWHGLVDGRHLDAWVTRGPTLELYLDAEPATHGVIHHGGALIQAVSRAVGDGQPMQPSPIDLEGTSVYADDPDWMRELLSRPEAKAAIHSLMPETSRATTALFIAPNAVRYMRRFLPLSEIEPGHMRQWLDELGKLATAVQAVGPSSQGLQPGRLETWARTERGHIVKRAMWILGVVMVAVMSALFLFAWYNVGTP